MSAYQDEKGNWTFSDPKYLNDPAMHALIEAQFDAECDVEILEYNKKQKEEKALTVACRLICIMRTVSFPTDILLIALMLPWRHQVKRRWTLQKEMAKYLFGRLTNTEILRSIKKHG